MSVIGNPSALQALLDKQDIYEVMVRYCRGVDRLDKELLRGTYWPEAWDDHGLFSGKRDEFIDWLMDYMGRELIRAVHAINNQFIELAGDRAFAETQFVGHYDVERDGQPFTRMSRGRYIDLFERRDGEWRVLRRTVVNDLGTIDPVALRVTLRTPGGRFPSDPVYRLRAEYLAVPVQKAAPASSGGHRIAGVEHCAPCAAALSLPPEK